MRHGLNPDVHVLRSVGGEEDHVLDTRWVPDLKDILLVDTLLRHN